MVKTAVFTGNRVPISGLSHWVKKEEMGTLLSIVTEGGPTRDLAWGFEVLCKKTTLCHYYMPSSVPISSSLTHWENPQIGTLLPSVILQFYQNRYYSKFNQTQLQS